MSRQLIAGGMYGDHLPTGTWCVLIPKSHIQTSMGRFALPPGETFGPLFLRCTDVDGFRFAGQAHDTENPAAWEATVWPITSTPWKPLEPPCCGVSPVIYDLFGMLHKSDCGLGLGSQGYRYVNASNMIVSGDATYKRDLGAGRFLFEYTDVGGLLIGQAAYDGGGVQVWDGSTLRQLELGDCRFIRANREGNVVALAFTKPEGVVLISTTMDDLRALPVVVPPANPKPPTPNPKPPTPEPPPMATVPNRASELDAFWFRWNAHQSITDEAEKHRFTAAFMAELNTLDGSGRWGRKARPGTNAISKDTAGYWLGTSIPTSPTDGKIHAFDLISGGDGSVHWDKAAEQGDPLYNSIDARWFPVSAAAPPGPTDPPPSADLTARVIALERGRAEDRQAAKDALQAVSDALQREIDAISPSRDPAALRAAVEAILSGYEVNGSTGRNLAHAHSLKLNLQRKP